jgi:hypothetical protein
MKQIIGFATQFYTLWNYEAVNQYRTDSYGNHHQTGVVHKYYYIKNISTDIDKVKTLFPNVEIDNELRGTSSFTRNEKLELPEGYFWGGKYAGKLIDEVIESDFQYCLWSAENYGGLTARYIKSHPKYIAHFEAIEKQKIADIEKAETVKVGDVIDLEFVSNGYNADDNYTECSAEARLGETVVYVNCSGVKPVNGMYPYLMPKINGKAQRTKGKKISVKVIEVIKTEIYGDIVEQHIKIA